MPSLSQGACFGAGEGLCCVGDHCRLPARGRAECAGNCPGLLLTCTAWSHPCVLWRQNGAGAMASQRELCAKWFLLSLCLFQKLHLQWIPCCSSSAHPIQSCSSCSDPLCKVLFLQMFPCLPTQLPLVEWGCFDCILFVCLFVCSDVWVLLPLFNCLFYLLPKQLVLFRS